MRVSRPRGLSSIVSNPASGKHEGWRKPCRPGRTLRWRASTVIRWVSFILHVLIGTVAMVTIKEMLTNSLTATLLPPHDPGENLLLERACA